MELQNYKIIKQIGSGAYSLVYLAESLTDHKQYIVKKIDFSHLKPKEKELLTSEVKTVN